MKLMLTPWLVVLHIFNGAASIHLALPFKFCGASRGLRPAALSCVGHRLLGGYGLGNHGLHGRGLEGHAAGTSKLARFMTPSTDVFVKVLSGVRIGSVETIFLWDIALESRPWLLLQVRLMPNQTGCHWVRVVSENKFKCSTILGACACAGLPKLGLKPALVLRWGNTPSNHKFWCGLNCGALATAEIDGLAGTVVARPLEQQGCWHRIGCCGRFWLLLS